MPHDRGPDPFTWGDLIRAGVFAAGVALMTIGAVVVVVTVVELVAH